MQPASLRAAGMARALTGAGFGRRRLLQALPAAAAFPALVALAAAAPARAANTDLALACDQTLGPAMRAVSTAYANLSGARVDVFPTALGLLLPQLERVVQNDIVVTQVATMEAAVAAAVVDTGAIRGAWHNNVVLAAMRGASPAPGRPIAVSDALPAADMDGPAILARLQLSSAALLGVVDTDTVVALLRDGTARAGLLHMTDVRAHPDLEVVRVVPDDIQPPLRYAAAITKLARRPDPDRMMKFLLAAQTTVLLASLGLEASSS
jgi:molybdate transport system substrate-binding protein